MSRLFNRIHLLCLVILTACGQPGDADQSIARQELNPPASSYVSPLACSLEDQSCQTLIDLYDRKPGFKEVLHSALVAADVPLPDWFEVGLSSRLTRKAQGAETTVVGRTCEPRNCAQFIYLAQNESTGHIYGFYRSNDRLVWFGEPNDLEKSLLCSVDQFCQLEQRTSEIQPQLKNLGLPEMVQLSTFSNCQEYKGGLSNLDGFVCREQFVGQCPYASSGCTVSAEFVGDQLAKIAFKYKRRQLKVDELNQLLDKSYGKASAQLLKSDVSNGPTVWLSEWSSDNVVITMRRVKGAAAQGATYDDVWLSLSDRGFVLFNVNPR